MSIEHNVAHIASSKNFQFRDDASKLHALIKCWMDNTADSNPWSMLVEAVDRIGEHDVAAELTTVVGVSYPGNIMVMPH